MANIHILKTHQEYFQATWDNIKKFEIRFNDRGYEVGDILRLQEIIFDGGDIVYTGRQINAKVTYILQLNEVPGIYNESIDDKWVVMNIVLISALQDEILARSVAEFSYLNEKEIMELINN